MTIDKTWIHITNRKDPAFKVGLDSFIEICKAVANPDGKAYCPCKKCINRYMLIPSRIFDHIYLWGFFEYYEFWDRHGEQRTLPAESIPYYFPQTSNPNTSGTNYEMLDVLDDVIGAQMTNEEETLEEEEKSDFDDLLQELNYELYPGCTWMSSLNFLAKLLHLKVINKWTDTSFTQLLELLRVAFPKENRIPSSNYEAKKKMRKIGLGYENIHACKNDCALFWKENANAENCPVCKESRWVDKNTKGKKVPNKVLRYFPLTPRLRRMYGSKFTAKDMIWHNTGRSTDGMLRHPVDGKAWMDFDQRYTDFSSEPRNVRLGLAADGFNPFGNMSLQYSMWPVVLTTYNTPPWVCMKESSFMLTLLIPGPRSPGKDMDVYLRPLVDELKLLWTDGVQTRDVSSDSVFTMRAALLWTINDYPARSSLSGWSGQGYKACATCNKDTPSIRLKDKIGYVGHRRFLSMKSKLRSDLSFDGKEETRRKPKRLTEKDILKQLSTLPELVPGKHGRNASAKRKRDEVDHNWNKRSIFFELEYWSPNELKHNLDVMHVEKNVSESLLGTLLMNSHSKDTVKARIDLENMGIRQDLWLTKKKNKVYQPHASYSFKPVDRAKFCEFIKGVRLPDGFGSNFKNKVDSKHNLVGLKSHDHHILMQRLLPIGVRVGLPENVSSAIINLCTFFKKICARSIDLEDMRKTQKDVVKILCNLELIFPPAFFDIMVHLVLHLPEEAILGGPVYMRWMYPFERYMKKLKAYVRNKAKPEGSIAEGYVADEALTFCSMYLEGVKTKFNAPDRDDDGGESNTQFSVFSSSFRTMSANTFISLTEPAKSSLQWFVLNNCDEVKDYIS
jgi:rubrerythrin